VLRGVCGPRDPDVRRLKRQYTLQDANIDELIEWSQTMLQKLRSLPELADATSDLLANAPQLRLTINRDQAARFGISPQLIDDTLNDA
jgi:multidrug efflux pump subunit AcrB